MDAAAEMLVGEWYEQGWQLFAAERADEVPAAAVREFVAGWQLAKLVGTSAGDDAWRALTDEGRRLLLADVFPDGTAFRRAAAAPGPSS